ncbi:bolA-like protein 3 [Trichomonascus vanleenenianus]|uniref:Bol3p n=1 Tax=Trichomonascus vanleenenianus TaxID=2268995 RepID=UPI003EC9AFAE
MLRRSINVSRLSSILAARPAGLLRTVRVTPQIVPSPTRGFAFSRTVMSSGGVTAQDVRASLGEYERQLYDKLKGELDPEYLDVRDISGGCGSMFAIVIHSPRFKGLTTVKQHRLVNEILKEEIAQWHGLQLRTKPC